MPLEFIDGLTRMPPLLLRLDPGVEFTPIAAPRTTETAKETR
jgi:hypothetical protein